MFTIWFNDLCNHNEKGNLSELTKSILLYNAIHCPIYIIDLIWDEM